MNCNYCGDLDWTIAKYGRYVHKQFCPNRGTDPVHQGQEVIATSSTLDGHLVPESKPEKVETQEEIRKEVDETIASAVGTYRSSLVDRIAKEATGALMTKFTIHRK